MNKIKTTAKKSAAKSSVKTSANVLNIDTQKVLHAIRNYFLGDECEWIEKEKNKPAQAKVYCDEGIFVINMESPKTELKLKSTPKAVLKALASGTVRILSKQEKEIVAKHLPIEKNVLEQIVSNPQQFFRAVKSLENNGKIFLEAEINHRWYPVPMAIGIQHSFFGGWYCNLTGQVKLMDESKNWRFGVTSGDFVGDDGKLKSFKLKDLLKEMGLRPSSPEALKEITARLAKSQKLANQFGKVVDVKSSVISKVALFYWHTLQSVSLGTQAKPRTLIIENDLESSERDDYYDENQDYCLPFIRAFSPDMKKYVYVDIADVEEHVFDHSGRDRLVLPENMRQILDAVFDTHNNDVFGDMFRGRHGGMVILANGPSGVGKTLTAEVFSEYTDRPLYVLEMGELGTNLESVEQNLQKIFSRASRWNAILLFDEADIFLSKRNEDLDRSAIVGVFLRLLDMYEGTFFLTTNRAEVMDPAFKSRITLRLDYPDLSHDSRSKVWKNLLKAAGFNVKDTAIQAIVGEELNGRQVRNVTRLLRVMHPGTSVLTAEQISECFKYVAR
ncbi:MAG TPA: ATP-binding protein [Anaerovoracaceae bacterium]|nr:ATP-binding protein [Anaerovoracaceae bacterium]